MGSRSWRGEHSCRASGEHQRGSAELWLARESDGRFGRGVGCRDPFSVIFGVTADADLVFCGGVAGGMTEIGRGCGVGARSWGGEHSCRIRR